MSHSLIVIVEDDQSIREGLQLAIELEGYEVRTANNGEEAFSLLKELKVPCLIFTDLMMPKMNGYEFIELASQTHTIASIPIVILSGTPNESEVKVMTESGKIKGLVKKPVSLDYLMSIVHEHCGPPPVRQDTKKPVNEWGDKVLLSSFNGARLEWPPQSGRSRASRLKALTNRCIPSSNFTVPAAIKPGDALRARRSALLISGTGLAAAYWRSSVCAYLVAETNDAWDIPVQASNSMAP